MAQNSLHKGFSRGFEFPFKAQYTMTSSATLSPLVGGKKTNQGAEKNVRLWLMRNQDLMLNVIRAHEQAS